MTREPSVPNKTLETSANGKVDTACKHFICFFNVILPRQSQQTQLLAALRIQFQKLIDDQRMTKFLHGSIKHLDRFFYERRVQRMAFFYESFRGQSSMYTKGSLEAIDLFSVHRNVEDSLFGNPRFKNMMRNKVIIMSLNFLVVCSTY
jgi:hypothetical protein